MSLAVSFSQLVVVAVILVVIVWPWTRIFGKAGYSPLLGLLIIVPLVNLGLIWYLALAEWPATKK